MLTTDTRHSYVLWLAQADGSIDRFDDRLTVLDDGRLQIEYGQPGGGFAAPVDHDTTWTQGQNGKLESRVIDLGFDLDRDGVADTIEAGDADEDGSATLIGAWLRHLPDDTDTLALETYPSQLNAQATSGDADADSARAAQIMAANYADTPLTTSLPQDKTRNAAGATSGVVINAAFAPSTGAGVAGYYSTTPTVPNAVTAWRLALFSPTR